MKHEELIALYFEDQLNVQQKLEFENLLRMDTTFKAQFELEQQVKTAIISAKKDVLKARLQQLEQPKKSYTFYLTRIAASIIIALGVFGIWQQNTPLDNNQLFTEYFEPYTNIIVPSERGKATDDDKTEAFRYYDTKNYTLASEKFEDLYKATSTSYYLFYQAICELQLENPSKAILLLETHQKYSDKVSEHRNWYLALAYLKANSIEQSKALLQQIISKKTYKYKAAKDILKKID
ncbi:hypothetical protein [Winogradskyella flava]|uniref:Tetratricopeptide repeat protein n=1 Tax=Winogradskyella flava TaxID=1884876 RepID=A0A842ILQ5_9FLAO|nr:hypothetical protein [Winogradskyella flava]MBC2844162.1 hypothetical protein [Winogradskyella flava]